MMYTCLFEFIQCGSIVHSIRLSALCSSSPNELQAYTYTCMIGSRNKLFLICFRMKRCQVH